MALVGHLLESVNWKVTSVFRNALTNTRPSEKELKALPNVVKSVSFCKGWSGPPLRSSCSLLERPATLKLWFERLQKRENMIHWLRLVGSSTAVALFLKSFLQAPDNAIKRVCSREMEIGADSFGDRGYAMCIPIMFKTEKGDVCEEVFSVLYFADMSCVMTVETSENIGPTWDPIADMLEMENSLLRVRCDPSMFLYSFADTAVDVTFAWLFQWSHSVTIAEELVYKDDVKSFADDAQALRAKLRRVRVNLWKIREVLSEVVQDEFQFLSAATKQMIPSVKTHCANNVQVVEKVMAQCDNLVSMYQHRFQKKVQRTVQQLTFVSLLLAPQVLWASLWSMNHEVNHMLTWRYGYAIFWLIAVFIAIFTVGTLRHRVKNPQRVWKEHIHYQAATSSVVLQSVVLPVMSTLEPPSGLSEKELEWRSRRRASTVALSSPKSNVPISPSDINTLSLTLGSPSPNSDDSGTSTGGSGSVFKRIESRRFSTGAIPSRMSKNNGKSNGIGGSTGIHGAFEMSQLVSGTWAVEKNLDTVLESLTNSKSSSVSSGRGVSSISFPSRPPSTTTGGAGAAAGLVPKISNPDLPWDKLVGPRSKLVADSSSPQINRGIRPSDSQASTGPPRAMQGVMFGGVGGVGGGTPLDIPVRFAVPLPGGIAATPPASNGSSASAVSGGGGVGGNGRTELWLGERNERAEGEGGSEMTDLIADELARMENAQVKSVKLDSSPSFMRESETGMDVFFDAWQQQQQQLQNGNGQHHQQQQQQQQQMPQLQEYHHNLDIDGVDQFLNEYSREQNSKDGRHSSGNSSGMFQTAETLKNQQHLQHHQQQEWKDIVPSSPNATASSPFGMQQQAKPSVISSSSIAGLQTTNNTNNNNNNNDINPSRIPSNESGRNSVELRLAAADVMFSADRYPAAPVPNYNYNNNQIGNNNPIPVLPDTDESQLRAGSNYGNNNNNNNNNNNYDPSSGDPPPRWMLTSAQAVANTFEEGTPAKLSWHALSNLDHELEKFESVLR